MLTDYTPGPRIVHCFRPGCGWTAAAPGLDAAARLLVGHEHVDEALIVCATCYQREGFHFTPPHVGRRPRPEIAGADDAIADARFLNKES